MISFVCLEMCAKSQSGIRFEIIFNAQITYSLIIRMKLLSTFPRGNEK